MRSTRPSVSRSRLLVIPCGPDHRQDTRSKRWRKDRPFFDDERQIRVQPERGRIVGLFLCKQEYKQCHPGTTTFCSTITSEVSWPVSKTDGPHGGTGGSNLISSGDLRCQPGTRGGEALIPLALTSPTPLFSPRRIALSSVFLKDAAGDKDTGAGRAPRTETARCRRSRADHGRCLSRSRGHW